MAYKQFGERMRPTEPQNCANHRTVQKSFLNQICEDCLLAELEAGANPSCNGDNPYETSVTAPETREGLIWDSEVKIEIEGQNMVSPTPPVVQNTSQPVIEPVDDCKQIFESQVEVTIEYEDDTVFEEELSSPIFTATQRNRCSWTIPVRASPPSACYAGVYESDSPTYRNERHRRDFQDKLSDLDDADDEFERAERFSANPQQTNRGRPLTRSNLHEVEKCQPDAGALAESVSGRTAGRNRRRFQGLRSLSTTFLSGARAEEARTDENSPTWTTSTLSWPGSRLKNPFRVIRSRKSSPLIQEPSLPSFPSTHGSEHIVNFEAQGSRSVLPRKSTLRDFTLLLARDLKRTQAVWPPSDGTSRNLVQSASSMGEDSDCDDQNTTFSGTQRSDSHSDTVFETDSRVASLHSEATPPEYVDGEASSCCVISSIPKSSTMNTLRAVINDLSRGFDAQDSFPLHSSISTDEKTVVRCRIADVAELGQMDTPEPLMHQEQLHDHQHVEGTELLLSALHV